MNKILFNFPTRGRVERFAESLTSLLKNITNFKEIEILVKLDNDDSCLEKYLRTISEIKYTPKIVYPISIEYGRSRNKVHAQNRSIKDYDWDILVNWSDDIIAQYRGLQKEIRRTFKIHGLDWCPCFWDGYRPDDLPVVAIMGKTYFDRFGTMLHPEYESLYADDEMRAVAKLLGKYEFIKEPLLFTHEHPNNTGLSRDEMYEKNESPYYYQKDGALFQQRRLINFGL